MARKKTNPEEEVNVTAAAEEPAPQDTPLTEAGMPPGDVPEATTGIDPTPPLSIEMPTAEEAGADEIPVPAEMQDTGKVIWHCRGDFSRLRMDHSNSM